MRSRLHCCRSWRRGSAKNAVSDLRTPIELFVDAAEWALLIRREPERVLIAPSVPVWGPIPGAAIGTLLHRWPRMAGSGYLARANQNCEHRDVHWHQQL